MAQIKKFFECQLPVSICNLKCEYCYVIQRENNTGKISDLDYSPEIMGKALTQERLGGICYFSICGYGETFVPDYLIDIVYQLLKNGHFVNITTNGTLTNKIKNLYKIPAEWLNRLHISFSFHYLELSRLNLLGTFFDNVRFVKSIGCSFIVQLNLYDKYVAHLNEIKELCMENIGAYPQIVATRKEESLTNIEIMSDYSVEEYKSIGDTFNSPLFDFTMKNFNVKRKEFCYAGSWSYTLDLKTGILKRCYASTVYQNIFKNIKAPIMDVAVGKECQSLFCLNSSHFMSLGVIPELYPEVTYAQLRNRACGSWYQPEMNMFLNSKLSESNKEYSLLKKWLSRVVGKMDKAIYKVHKLKLKMKG